MNTEHAVVFLHAFPLSASMWEPQLAAIGDAHRTFAPHLPGFGGRAPTEPDLGAFARAVLADLDAEGIDTAIFVGLSMGGYVAFRLLAEAPERVRGLVLADTRAGADDAAGKEKRTAQAERARSEGIGWLPDALVPALLGSTTRKERPEVEAQVRALIGDADPEGVARALLAMRDRPDSTPLLAGVRVPTLVMVGDEDGLTPPEAARELEAAIPGARLQILSAAGHLSNLEAPLAFNDALLRFVAEVHGTREG